MNMNPDFEHAWLDIYLMLEDNAFDHRHVWLMSDGSAYIGHSRFEEVPF